MWRPSVTAAVAALALFVGGASAIGGALEQRSADRKVCRIETQTNAAVRGLLDDFIGQNPNVTAHEVSTARGIALGRFPEEAVLMKKPWQYVGVIAITLWLALAIVFSIVAVNQAVGNAHTLCVATQASWVARDDMIHVITEPSKLSPEATHLFPGSATDSLRLQIEQANLIKANNRSRLLRENEHKPHC